MAGKRRVIVALLIAVVAVVACLLVGLASIQLVQYGNVEEKIRAKGEPITMAALDSWYPEVPDERNAAILVQQAAGMVVEPARDAPVPIMTKYELPQDGAPLPEDVKAAVREVLEANRGALETVAEAAALPESRYGDFSAFVLGAPGSSSHLDQVRQVCRLLVLQAVYQADAGDGAGAAKSLEQAAAIGDTLKMEPILLSQLVRQAVTGLVFRRTDYVLNRGSVPEASLAALQARLASTDDPQALYRAMVGERCYSQQTPGVFRGAMLRAMTEVVDASTLPEVERRARCEELAQEYKAASGVALVFRPSSVMTGVLVPLAQSNQSFDRASAQVRVASAAVAVERYRIEKAALPESLDALVPKFLEAVPLDPFDGKPLRYVVKDGGYVVYSVAINGVDDGGVANGKRDGKTGDIVMMVGSVANLDDGGQIGS